jgi:hypothetical protein
MTKFIPIPGQPCALVHVPEKNPFVIQVYSFFRNARAPLGGSTEPVAYGQVCPLQPHGNFEMKLSSLAAPLGWFSIGLGLAELLVPRRIAQAHGRPEAQPLVRGFGAREIAAGSGSWRRRAARSAFGRAPPAMCSTSAPPAWRPRRRKAEHGSSRLARLPSSPGPWCWTFPSPVPSPRRQRRNSRVQTLAVENRQMIRLR